MSDKLRVTGTIWIASDIHLSEAHPETRRAFMAFLQQARIQAQSLFLCGDIFDVWIGDDLAVTSTPHWLAEVVAALRQTASHIPVWIGRGNRDFLMGQAFAQTIGAHLLPDEVVLATDAGNLLLAHGDTYCTDDRSYQRMRKLVRCRVIQWIFMQLDLQTRRRIAQWARQRSMSSNVRKPRQIMDVNQEAITQALRRMNVSIMVHGHTHRPALHTLLVDGRKCLRYVLPDWELDAESMRGGWLQVNADGIDTIPVSTLSP